MRPHLSLEDYAAFTDQLIAEAESTTGTWTLATYHKLQNAVREFPLAACDSFLQRTLELLGADMTRLVTCYKLAQICSAIHTLRVPDFDRLFIAFEERASKTYERIAGAGYLGRPTVQLLQSLARQPGRLGLSLRGDQRKSRHHCCSKPGFGSRSRTPSS
jgi:hypothetical protein